MMTEVITLTQQLINIPSISPNDHGCQTVIKNYLEPLGFQCETINHPPVSNLWALYGQPNTPCFVFAGHTDVVEPGEHWDSDPFKANIRDGFLYGRGAADMKGALAAMLVATKQFMQTNPNFPGQIGFLITSGEEGDDYQLGTPKIMEYLQQSNQKIDYCLLGEPSSSKVLGDTLKIGRRGSLSAQLIIKGKQGHVAYPHLAANPIHLAAPFLQALSEIAWDQGNTHFPPTTLQISHIHAGENTSNVIPGELFCRFNLRFSPKITAEKIKSTIENLLQQHQLNYKITWTLSGNPFINQDPHFIKLITDALPTRPILSTDGGTSDGRFIAPYGINVIELGLVNKTIHQVNEKTAVVDLENLAKIYQKILQLTFKS